MQPKSMVNQQKHMQINGKVFNFEYSNFDSKKFNTKTFSLRLS